MALVSKGYEVFLPTYCRRTASNRDEKSERPLFPGYLFCRCTAELTGKIVTTSGVFRIIGYGTRPIAISESEIVNLQKVTASDVLRRPWKYLPGGTVVRIESGPLKGVEGIIVSSGASRRLIVNVTLLQRSTAVSLDENQAIVVLSRPRTELGIDCGAANAASLIAVDLLVGRK